jgi:hypothetical protein
MGLADDLANATYSAPELNNSPDLALSAAQTPDPQGNAQVLAHTANTYAMDKGYNAVTKHIHSGLLPGILGSFGGALHDTFHALGTGFSFATHILNKPLQEVQHEYRYLHDVEARHGPLAAMLEGLGIAGGAALGSFLPGFGTAAGAAIGGELAGEALGHLAYRDSYDRTAPGKNYVDPNTQQPVSLGRDVGRIIGLKPGSKPFTAVSGLGDAISDLTLDPLAIAGGAVHEARAAQIAVRDVADIDKVAQVPRVNAALEDMANSNAGQIVTKYPKFAGLASELGSADSVDAVKQVFKDNLKVEEITDKNPWAMPTLGLGKKLTNPLREVIGGIEGQGPITNRIESAVRRQSLLPTWLDPNSLKLSATEFDPAAPNAGKTVYQSLRMFYNRRVAEGITSNFLNETDVGNRITILKQAWLDGLLKMGIPEDSEVLRNLKGELDGLDGGVKLGSSAEYGYDMSGKSLSDFQTRQFNTIKAGILENQTGNITLPDFHAVNSLRRSLNGYTDLFGKADDFFYNHFTYPIFKRFTLLTGGFAERIAASELIPNMLRLGPGQVIKGRLASSAADYNTYADGVKQWAYKAADLLGHERPSEDEIKNMIPAIQRARGWALNLLTDTDRTTMDAALIKTNDGHITSSATNAGHALSSNVFDAPQRAEHTIYKAAQAAPQWMKTTDEFGSFAASDLGHSEAWHAATAEMRNSPAAQAGAKAYLKAMQETVEERTANEIPAASLYHGTARPITEMGSRYEMGAGAANLYGPGFYTTESPEIASKYTSKELARAREQASQVVHGIEPKPGLRFINLENALPDDAREAFRNVAQPLGDASYLDVTEEDHNKLMQLIDSNAPGKDIYRQLRTTLTGNPRSEVDEILNDLHDVLENQGYAGFQHVGGQIVGNVPHNVTVFFNPQRDLDVASTTQAFKTVQRGATMADATTAAQRAVKDVLDSMGDSELGNYVRHTDGSHDDWATTITEAMKGVTHSALRDTGEGGVPHLELLRSIANPDEHALPSLDWFKAVPDEMRPAIVKGRILQPVAPPGIMEKVANAGFNRVLSPMINWLSRESTYETETWKQFSGFLPAIKRGEMEYADALHIAQQKATENMLPFIHNTLERTQFAEAARNFMPFWFAQQQAFKRYGRLLAEDPAAFRRFQLMASSLTEIGHTASDKQGGAWFNYPGTGFLGLGVPKILSNLGIPMTSAAPVSFAGDLTSLNTIFPGSEGVRPGLGPMVTMPLHLMESFMPESRPVVKEVIGPQSEGEDLWKLLVPNTFIQRSIQAFAGQHSRSFQNAMMQTIQQMDYLQNQHPDRHIVPGPDAGPMEQQQFIDRVKNQTRVNFALKALLGLVTPASPQFKIGDLKLRQEVRDEVKTKGLIQGTNDFLAAHPDATPYTVFQSKANVAGAPLSATADAENFYNQHRATLDQYPYAGAWLIPQSNKAFNQAVYNEQLAQGLRQHKAPDQFLQDLYTAAGNHQYFEVDLKAHNDAIAAANGDKNAIAQENANWQDYVQNTLRLQNPVWYDNFTSTDRQTERVKAIEQLDEMAAKNLMPDTSLSRDIRGLLDDYHTFVANTPQGQDTISAQARKASKADFKAYLDQLKNEKPSLAPLIQKVFDLEITNPFVDQNVAA